VNDPFGLSADREPDDATGRAAFPCFFRAPDEPDRGPLNRAELLALLNQLLEGERAGARGLTAMRRQAANGQARAILGEIAGDEARFCAMLLRHVARLGGTPSQQTGAFYTKLVALERTDERLDLLNRGQGWVVRKLSEALPRIADPALRADLQDMLEAHLHNIERCTELGATEVLDDCAPRGPRGAT
jgi:hypothetical protein